MKKPKIIIIDYGMGNTWSVISAINYLGYECELSREKSKIINADSLILPGVGSFNRAIKKLKDSNIFDFIKEAVINKEKKILGICLGFQLLGMSSEENGLNNGLEIIPAKVKKFSFEPNNNFKIPHVGFNSVNFNPKDSLFSNINQNSDFYFVHSYRFENNNIEGLKSISFHGEEFIAAYHHKNIFGTQFHPEKSQSNGLRLLKNFINH